MLLGDGGKLESLADYQRLVTDLYDIALTCFLRLRPGGQSQVRCPQRAPLNLIQVKPTSLPTSAHDVPAGVQEA
jgi:hypothetical protein